MVFKAAEANLRPDDFVIGVAFGGKTRAYRLGALENPMGHLVNDMIDGVAISVAYCDLTRCVRSLHRSWHSSAAGSSGRRHAEPRNGHQDWRKFVFSTLW